MSLLTIEECRNSEVDLKLLMQRVLTGTIMKNKWWYALKLAITFASIRYKISLVVRERIRNMCYLRP